MARFFSTKTPKVSAWTKRFALLALTRTRIGEAVLSEEAFAFVEIHIEQGPVLEAEDLQVAVVEGIVGQSRLGFRFAGHANHAGTTPMHLRHDALAAAASGSALWSP